jgi:hypothetical protein
MPQASESAAEVARRETDVERCNAPQKCKKTDATSLRSGRVGIYGVARTAAPSAHRVAYIERGNPRDEFVGLRWQPRLQTCYCGLTQGGAPMNERRDDDNDRDRGHRDDRNGRGGPKRDGDQGGGGGSDTRFLQLEMSRVLYQEAEDVTRPAFRELLREAAKDHLRARFGDTISRLAQLAVDELLIDIEANLDIEDQIQRRRESAGTDDRLREALARRGSARAPSPAAPKKGGTSASRSRRK